MTAADLPAPSLADAPARLREIADDLGDTRSRWRHHAPALAAIADGLVDVLDELDRRRATVTTGGPPRAVDAEWANGSHPPPETALDPDAPALRRGPL